MLEPHLCCDNLIEDRSLYATFKYAVIENGYISWRRSTSDDNIFTVNDVSMTNGHFQEDVYVHLTMLQTDSLTDMFYTCAMYSVHRKCKCKWCCNFNIDNFDKVSITNLKCCHIRLFDIMINDHMPSLISKLLLINK